MVTVTQIANGHGVEFSCTQQVNIQQLCESKFDLAKRFPQLASWYFAIVDLTGITALNVTAEEIPLLVERDNELAKVVRPALPLAIVAPEALTYDISRIWQAVSASTGWESKIFRERSAAETWLRHRVSAAYRVELPSHLAA
jgi:hypothetical protein